jgi:hypothetical protein
MAHTNVHLHREQHFLDINSFFRTIHDRWKSYGIPWY